MEAKVYLKNALEALGSKKEIDFTSEGAVLEVREEVQACIQAQLSKDDKTKANVQKTLQYEQNMVYELTKIHGVNFEEQAWKDIVSELSQDTASAADVVAMGLLKGVGSQPGMDEKTAEELGLFWDKTLFAEYKQFLKSNNISEEQLGWEQYCARKNKRKIINALASRMGGDKNKAEQLLKEEIDMNHPLLQNPKNHKLVQIAKDNRTEKDGPFVFMDLFALMSKSITSAQIQVFYESRDLEQRDQNIGLASDTKLANVLGKSGKGATEEIIGKKLSNNIVPYEASTTSPSLPEHNWRGYQELAALIKQTVNNMYAGVQTTGFSERLMGKEALLSSPDVDTGLEWETDYKEMPKSFGESENAKTFYDEIQMRIMTDKVALIAAQTELEKECEKLGVVNISDLKKTDLKEKVEYMEYLENRIKTAVNVLNETEGLLNYQPEFQDNKKYFDSQKEKIADAMPEGFDDKVKNQIIEHNQLDYKNIGSISRYVGFAFEKFSDFSKCAEGSAEKDASYKMIAALFSVENKFKNNDITSEELESMLNSDKKGPFDPDIATQLVTDLENGKISTGTLRDTLHNAAARFMEEKHKVAVASYKLSEKTAEDLEKI